MADQMRPASPQAAPDPARSYGREKPQAEAGLGRLDNNTNATPTDSPDHIDDPVKNKQAPRQINAQDVTNGRSERELNP